ncbi:ABC transporter substrate-binding protein [Actinocatenispora rupis]|uniref:Sugar ABC transporter substrate-binding protein n=1 Tax=Actinocatenispora rupis TaxID=519421 RepID=A0A8J3J4W7_9ACTN|nr:extracellular solute-binding protein [Actinocatenispora rupis]GID09448.1 sugar ABC transporter substrate-binding protein [Actinocatenispora rupis]
MSADRKRSVRGIALGGTDRRLRVVAVAAAAAGLFAVAACAPGTGATGTKRAAPSGPVSTDPAKAGKVTLTEWDQNTSDSGMNDATEALNKAFEKKYPNVTIKRVSRSFQDLKTTLKLALSSNDPPDVVQANQGYPDMGAFVKAGLLTPVNRYSDVYGWGKAYPAELLNLNRFSADGKTWRTGDLYGISQTGEIVGVYYNKAVLKKLGVAPPVTYADFAAALPKVKAKGTLPVAFGNSDKSPAIQLFGVTNANTAGKQTVRDLVFDEHGKSWTNAGSEKAATTIQSWAKKGYLSPGFNGMTMDSAQTQFTGGKTAFMLNGTWAQADVQQKLGAGNVGFVALAPSAGATPVTQGGEGLAWSITSKSKHPDVAAAYLNFITNPAAMTEIARTGALPALPPASYQPPKGTVAADILAYWRKVSTGDGLVPYLDYTTPTFYDTLTTGLQELLAGHLTPAAFGKQLQTDYDTFRKNR